jgi:uncharacterized membrane protein
MAKHNNKLPPAQDELAQQVIRSIRAEYSGPLPPPSALEHYNNIIPNGAERIMAMAEQQSRHRQELEKLALSTDSRNSLLGIISGFIIGLVTVISGGIIAYNGLVWPGTIFGSVGLVGLVSVFIYGTKQRRQERAAKAKSK